LGLVIQTVLGPIAPEDLGATSMHEHLLCDATALSDDALLDDPDAAARGLAGAGLGAVVDPTVPGFGGPDPRLPQVARAAGVHVVAGAGAYLGRLLPDWLHAMSVDELTAYLVGCLEDGLPGCGFRAGVLGLIGTGHPVAPVEERVLRATAAAALETGAGVIARVDGRAGGATPGLDLLLAEGVPGERIVLSNVDGLHADRGRLRELLATGAALKWSFGYETPPRPGLWSATDAQRLDALAELAGEGRHVLACGIWTRGAQAGFGYGHLMRTVVPALRERGVDPEPMLRAEPRRILTRAARTGSPRTSPPPGPAGPPSAPTAR
jgi:phosphotriesterase-related protein